VKAVMPRKTSGIFQLITAGGWFDGVATDASP